jgi:hypothetical protein
MSTLFADIRAAAKKGAATGARDYAAPVGFDGTRHEPSPGFVVPIEPFTKTLYPYQRRVIETILTSGLRSTIVGLLPGMGKTVCCQAVAAARVAKGDRVVCVVPPTLIYSPWIEEFALDFPKVRTFVAEGKKASSIPSNVDVVVISDAIISDRLDDITAWKPRVVIGDEGHRYKNRTAARAKAMRTLCDSIPEDGVVAILTGTIADNTLVDVWHTLRVAGRRPATALSGGPGYKEFLDAWCHTETIATPRGMVRKATGCRDARGLRDRLTSTSMLSIDPGLVLDLPERQWVVRNLTVSGAAVETYKRVERDLISFIRETKDDAAAWRAAKAEALVMLMTLWKHDGMAKVDASVAYGNALLEQDEPLVVWGHHKEVLGRLYDGFTKHARVGSIIGGMTAEQKADVVRRFQDGNLDVIVANIVAGGTGVTLTRSAHSMHVQLPWSPGQYQQSCARIHRISQTRPTTFHTMLMADPEGISTHVWNVLKDKAATNDVINADCPITIDEASVTESVLRHYSA